MRVIITVGYQQILLPSDAGLQSVLKVLAKGVECRDYRWDTPPRIEVSKCVNVEVRLVPDDTTIVIAPKSEEESDLAPLFAKTPRVNGQRAPRLGHDSR